MKKSLLTFAASLLMAATTTLSAAPQQAELLRAKPLPDFRSSMKEMAQSATRSASRSAEAPGEVIYEVDGAAMPMDRLSSGFYVYADVEYYENVRTSTEFVFGNDGYVYIKDIMSMLPFGSYIRGEVDPETFAMKFQFPQTIDNDDDYEWYDINVYYAQDLMAEMPTVVDAEKNYITFNYMDDGSIVMEELPEGCFIGVTMQPYDMWGGMAETAISLVEPTGGKETVTIPEGADIKRFSYITYGVGQYDPSRKPDFGYRVDVAFDGDDVYFRGLSSDDASICFKGTRQGNLITVPNNQFLGILSGVYEVYVMFGHKDAEAYGGYALLPENTVMTLNYDEQAGTITLADPEIVMFFNLQPNNNPNNIYYLQMFEDLKLTYQPVASGAPAAPWGLYFSPITSASSLAIFDFNLPVLNADGVVLERENMYYNIFLDNELWELSAEDFNIPETLVNVPYGYKSSQIVAPKTGTFHELGFRVEGFETIGVQCFNVWDGVTYSGPRATININTGEVTFDEPTSGLAAPAAEGRVVSEEYFDLSGRHTAAPSHGLCIKRTVLDNGTVTFTKVIR